MYELNQMLNNSNLSLAEKMYAHHLILIIRRFFDGKEGNCFDFTIGIEFEELLSESLI